MERATNAHKGPKGIPGTVGIQPIVRGAHPFVTPRSTVREAAPPPGPVRRPRGLKAADSPSPLVPVRSGPTHAGLMEALPHRRDQSARTGARPHTGSTPRSTPRPRPSSTRLLQRTTIPPYGTPPLNGRDAANYAVFTVVLLRGAYSQGLGQTLLQPGPRSCSPGRTQHECRAPTATRRPSVCRGVAHVQGATRAERKARHRSRPRGNQQRRPRPAGQRPRRAARADTSLRQDVGGAVGVEGHGAAGRRAPSHRRRDRRQARPSGAAARDRPRGRRPGPRGRARLPARRGRGGEIGHRALPSGSGGPPGGQRGHLAVAGRFFRSERLRHARVPLADNPRRLGGAGRGVEARSLGAPGSQGAPEGRGAPPRVRAAGPGPVATALPRVGHSDVAKLREAAEDARRWDSKYGGGDWRSSMVPGVPTGGRGPAAARVVLGRGGPRAVRRDRGTDPAGRVDGLRHRSAGGGAAVLHPGAAAGPRRGGRAAGRVRTGFDVAAGDLPRLRRRGRRPRPGGPGAQPRASPRPAR